MKFLMQTLNSTQFQLSRLFLLLENTFYNKFNQLWIMRHVKWLFSIISGKHAKKSTNFHVDRRCGTEKWRKFWWKLWDENANSMYVREWSFLSDRFHLQWENFHLFFFFFRLRSFFCISGRVLMFCFPLEDFFVCKTHRKCYYGGSCESFGCKFIQNCILRLFMICFFVCLWMFYRHNPDFY